MNEDKTDKIKSSVDPTLHQPWDEQRGAIRMVEVREIHHYHHGESGERSEILIAIKKQTDAMERIAAVLERMPEA